MFRCEFSVRDPSCGSVTSLHIATVSLPLQLGNPRLIYTMATPGLLKSFEGRFETVKHRLLRLNQQESPVTLGLAEFACSTF